MAIRTRIISIAAMNVMHGSGSIDKQSLPKYEKGCPKAACFSRAFHTVSEVFFTCRYSHGGLGALLGVRFWGHSSEQRA